MKVKHWMTKDPVTIAPDASISEAARIMKERGFRRLPVIDGGRLIGLVTYRNILEAQPSAASTLSVHEARYLVEKLKVSDVMRKNPITVSPDDDVIAAMLEGQRRGLGAYPVVEGERLVGIVTASDLFILVAHILGSDSDSEFIYLAGEAESFQDNDFIASMLGRLKSQGIRLLSYLSFPGKQAGDSAVLLLKISPGSRAQAARLLSADGLRVLD